jgi:ATP-dependent Clp protease ATP-binding subunit ClpC
MRLLEQYSDDLTLKASRAEPIIGRDKEIEEIIGILCRKNKNNPALIGEPGVGKTAIIEALAQRIVADDVPPQLLNKRLLSVNMGNLVSGTKYRGEFEERMRDLLREVQSRDDIILFVDEMHTIVGAGAAEGAIDASNILKPVLGRGEIQLIGATTLAEYRKYIEADAALARRFRPVMVEEPSAEDTLAILKALKPGLERHHRLKIADEALTTAIQMSARYLPDLFLPDKAIDLIDEAAAHAVIASQKCKQNKRNSATVTDDDVAWAVSARTGIPVTRLTADERERLINLEYILASKVIGQTEAVKTVADAVRRGLSKICDERRPTACMLFTGPTGVGKTELCRVLAEEVYGSTSAMIRLDMSEYMEKHSVSQLIGAPPGYVGHERGGKLTEAIHRRPYSLVLLDEIEKAHPDVANILLQIMEEGELTDSMGRKVSFKNAIVVMTANIGSGSISKVGFFSDGKKAVVKDELHNYFKPELLGRLDKIVCFDPLTESAMNAIVQKYLTELSGRMADMGIKLEISETLPQYILSHCNIGNGARELRHQVQEMIESPLATYLLKCEKGPTNIKVAVLDNRLRLNDNCADSCAMPQLVP